MEEKHLKLKFEMVVSMNLGMGEGFALSVNHTSSTRMREKFEN